MSKEPRSWSHAFRVKNDEIFAKKLRQSIQKQRWEGQKEKRKQEKLLQTFLRYISFSFNKMNITLEIECSSYKTSFTLKYCENKKQCDKLKTPRLGFH